MKPWSQNVPVPVFQDVYAQFLSAQVGLSPSLSQRHGVVSQISHVRRASFRVSQSRGSRGRMRRHTRDSLDCASGWVAYGRRFSATTNATEPQQQDENTIESTIVRMR